jgi:hypothetical protein
MMTTIAYPVSFAAVIQRSVAANLKFILGDQATAKKAAKAQDLVVSSVRHGKSRFYSSRNLKSIAAPESLSSLQALDG